MNKNLRTIFFFSVVLIFLYLSIMVIINTKVENSNFGYIDFNNGAVGNFSALLGALFGVVTTIIIIETL